MATVLGLAMKISADASGVQKALTPVQRALQQLDKEAAGVTAVFDKFGASSAAAAAQQEKFAVRLAALNENLRSGITSPEEYARSFDVLREAATEAAADLDAAARIIEANLTREEKAQRDFAQSTAELDRLRKQGMLTDEDYAKGLERIAGEYAKATLAADKYGDVFREGAAVTEANRTQEEKRADELDRLNKLLELGAISQETFSRASMEASGANDAALAAAKVQADAEKVRADATTRAAAIVEANLTKEQRAQRDYSVATRELNSLRNQGLLTEKEYSTALQRVSTDYAKATLAADKFGRESGKGGDAGVLKFNELSGVLSALPGPIGNVAGRLSGLSSAGEGLARVFSGGLSQGIASIGTSVAGLINPFTAAVAGVAAFAAGATAVARGLVDLEDRVERLGNTADKLGVSFEFIQTLEAAAARSGTSVEAVSAAFGRLQKNVTGVDEESKAAQAALASIGVTAEQLSALKPEEQYKLIGESIQAIEDPAKRTAASMGLFGKSGADLLPFFKNLGGAASDMERFGRALTDIDRQRIDDFGAGLDALGVATQGLGQSVLLPFAGLGEGVTKAFAEIIAGITAVVDPIGRVLSPLLFGIGRVIELIGTSLGNLGRAIGAVFEPFAVVVEAISENFFGIEKAAESAVAGIDGTAESVKELTKDEQKAFDELTKQIERSDEALNGAINKAAEFGQAGFDAAFEFQQALEELDAQAADKELNAEQYARGVANATVEFEKQIESVKRVQEETKKAADEANKAADEAAKRAEADQKRIEGLLSPGDAASKVQEEIAFVIEQQVKAEEELAAARAKSDKSSADAASARLAQLDGLRTKLEDQAQAIDQGFAEGFASAFEATASSVSDLVDKAGEFGNAGAEAAASLQAGIEAVQEQVRDGVIPKSAYEQEIENQKRVFNERLQQIEEARRTEQEARDAIFAQQVSANERVNAFLNQSTAAEIAAAEEVAARRQQVAFNIEAIQQRLLTEQQSLEAAREQGDLQAAAAAVERINQLKEALTVEQQIAEGRQQQIADQKQLIADQQVYQEQQQKAVEQYQQQQQQAQQAYAQEQAKIFEEQQKSAAAEAKRQEERLTALNTLGSRTIRGTDVRTQEGAALVINLAANAQDPAAIAARQQTKYLEQIAQGIGQAASNYFNSPVAIVGYSSFGAPR
jgi:hypothetical protein